MQGLQLSQYHARHGPDLAGRSSSVEHAFALRAHRNPYARRQAVGAPSAPDARLSALYLSSLSSAALKSGGLGLGRVQVDHALEQPTERGAGLSLRSREDPREQIHAYHVVSASFLEPAIESRVLVMPCTAYQRWSATDLAHTPRRSFELDGRARASSIKCSADSRLPRAGQLAATLPPFPRILPPRQGRHRGRLRLSDLHRKELFAASCPLRPPILSARFRGKLGAHSRDHLSDRGLSPCPTTSCTSSTAGTAPGDTAVAPSGQARYEYARQTFTPHSPDHPGLPGHGREHSAQLLRRHEQAQDGRLEARSRARAPAPCSPVSS
ncbi:hypothetical protein Q5P01_000079 [Channa striata]|uniref:Uncharacterized protein n=1 Tax=Channa striata TaxID=64152 RepID=A0AA88IK27_CHASR|nr:hypothetical protein Q5P01_000079 [Channa striata]